MPGQQERIAYLLEAYSSRKATAAETAELFQWLKDNPQQPPFNEHIRQLIDRFDPREPVPAVDWESLYRQILEEAAIPGPQARPGTDGPAVDEDPTPYPLRPFTRRRLTVAASIILLLGAGLIYFIKPRPTATVADTHPVIQPPVPDIAPGANGAVLTLAGGQKIVLDSAGNGRLALQGNTQLLNQHGQLSYQHARTAASEEVLYNTITTTRGRQYQLVLADGSKVWLNASSSLTFPTAFTGNNRTVEMTGEAYFEIAKNPSHPFRVLSHGMEVQVLGTSFNINAYTDETLTRTTLLEGSVKVLSGPQGQVLTAGQQAQLNQSGGMKVTRDADLQEVVAWKDGLFLMKKADIATTMRQIARWYDVEIVYPGGAPTGRISGDIPRNMNLSKVLEVMALSGVHFTIEGKKVMVTP